ncbi:glycosyltransferase [Dolosicoccus paucivorans]|uniref:Glycosyltransferase n=1 Tax=Dolosicoccus paucivorans TaxID=84521 RepID=A0A1G8LJW9_9LACT|nr:glycosyltransferase [Dolosicoccus paucivorans]PMB84642.1 glycosyltransferase [Dolosicoccus paucivorans]PMC59254.1 glycosyltransferase [Dolosicoccus paucivorans]SDI55984.1 Glycosyltransferase involved in cell wall bisynthesis [Dolosicoccus paucivorans]
MEIQLKPIRILHIMSGFGGGISTFIRNQAEALTDTSIIFDVATYDDCPEEFKQAIEKTGGRIYSLQNPKTKGWKEFKKSLQQPLKEHHYDVVHCHVAGYRAIAYYLVVRKYKVGKFIIHAHSTVDLSRLSKKKQYEAKINQPINRYLSHEPVGCGALAIQSIYGKVPKEQWMIIPNSVEPANFIHSDKEATKIREQVRTRWQVPEDHYLIGHIGRLEEVKNHQLTLELAQWIKNQQLPMTIVIIGTGKLKEALKEQVKEKGLESVVLFTGRLHPIANYLPALDGVILPSFVEGLPTTMIETQLVGLPAVLSDTITKEVDLELGLLTYLPLDSPISKWYDELITLIEMSKPSTRSRIEQASLKGFTNEAASSIYTQYLSGFINSYHID